MWNKTKSELISATVGAARKMSLILILTAFLVGGAYGEDKITVAAILPLTGEAASFGASGRNGITLALEDISENAKRKLEIIYEDDGLLPKNSVAALKRLTSTQKIDIIFNFSSGTANALAPIAEQKKIPLIAIASDPAVSRGRKYAFNFWVTPEAEVKALIAEMNRRGYKRIARAHTSQDGVLAVKRAFDEQNNGQFEIVVSEDFLPDLKDFRFYITKLRAKEKEIDGLMLFLMPGQLSTFAKQLRALGNKSEIFGAEIFEDANEVALAQGALLGSWYVNADDGIKAFLDRYKARFPNQSSMGAANNYDFVMLLGKAIDSGVKAKDLNQFFATIKNFSGALGTYSATGDGRFDMPAAVKVVTADGFRKLQ